jgi:hypothetical protein
MSESSEHDGTSQGEFKLSDGISIPWRLDPNLPLGVVAALVNPATGSGTALLRDGTFVDVQLEASDA